MIRFHLPLRSSLLLWPLLLLSTASACQGQPGASATAPADTTFAHHIAALSEPGGYFDTDNLISNESSYLHVLGAMRVRGVEGGAYIGVGPDQNFSYIAQVRPRIAFMIDIRRDNLLQHLLFKALFELARDRLDYLCLLFGKAYPDGVDAAAWTIEQLVAYIEQAAADPSAAARVRTRVASFAVPLDDEDRRTIDQIHERFIGLGLGLRFTSHGRPPMAYYPTFRQLLLETDLDGRRGNYLVREDGFQYIKRLQMQDLIIPVVGNLAGPHALAAIGEAVAARGLAVSVLYTSNVEYYLMRQGAFGRFAQTVAGLPWAPNGVIVRSYFNRYSAGHPQTVPGYASTQLMQPAEAFVDRVTAGGYQSYYDLISRTVETR